MHDKGQNYVLGFIYLELVNWAATHQELQASTDFPERKVVHQGSLLRLWFTKWNFTTANLRSEYSCGLPYGYFSVMIRACI